MNTIFHACTKESKALSPLGEFVRANYKFWNVIGWRKRILWRLFSLTNHDAVFGLRFASREQIRGLKIPVSSSHVSLYFVYSELPANLPWQTILWEEIEIRNLPNTNWNETCILIFILEMTVDFQGNTSQRLLAKQMREGKLLFNIKRPKVRSLRNPTGWDRAYTRPTRNILRVVKTQKSRVSDLF